ncbi:golgin candidate 6 isoform X3 [Diospyros lotus]|uniref:golgin candidate 6 isoform X1 n=1 Tax=Diospyros lotus TaxID=55363 RepID=UPI0022559730|nr:golgin candidate 6 isoform X1 [Diospyros lotus]XP_052209055.1 golgin candidate 6 isoform X2 [Diospyros lotus]XP_052209057.1 golgin candidate 6 isoform X1 [Diospyros lotus]XP_052209058.1 golgin candidate 6 isoform X2 [Diospyros lotus]XP_052209059.1 golgin candidate 6 isoform X3 [Diospyros lotus]XP_052209060.1 golgin candidate 6 isoform X4 [Diospyros lotus]XP_052209061.1 golgin candidate 6 isoform X5 [Diospyros lotus]XP_052209062.1 golgin candidate 6 isoform X3 [Diospyros lotus]XP_05220906
MDLMSGYKNRVQGVVGLVFGNDNSSSSEDSYVERLLDRISNGVLAGDRRTAILELQSVLAESRTAQLAFGAMGFPVLLSVLKEERDDVEMVRGVLETLVSALTPIGVSKGSKNEVQPALMNADMLSREAESISLLISLLSEEDFYIRYYTLQLLTALLTNSQTRLQEAILTIPHGITRLMDMLMDREVIRNEALLLLTYLTHEAEEIQKIIVFEGAFEKIFSIIKEEGGSDGGVVVQDCLELLNNLLHKNASNQVLLRETMGFDPLISILKLRGNSYSFTQQKTINLLGALETINLLIMGGPETDPGKDGKRLTNKTVLVQKKILDHLLVLGVESQWAPVAVRCMALRCIGNLITSHPKNLDALANKVLGEESQVEPALNSVLRIVLRAPSIQEFLAADYIFKCFCEKNPDGQTMLASTLIPQPQAVSHASHEEDVNMSFGSMLLHGLNVSENDGDLETCGRAASVLSHILTDNIQCKEKFLRIELEAPTPSLGAPEPLLHRMVKYLVLASSMKSKDGKSSTPVDMYVQPIMLKLLVIWLLDCPNAVHCFLDSRPHITYLLELVSNSTTTAWIRGLAALLLGECVIYNKSSDRERDAFTIVDAISDKLGLTSYFLKFDEMKTSIFFSSGKTTESRKPLSRSPTAASMEETEDVDEHEASNQKNEDHPMLASIFDGQFVDFVGKLEANIRESIVDVYSHPKRKVAVVPAELEQKGGETDGDYIKRLKSFVERQCSEIQDLLSRNATLAEDLAKMSGGVSRPEHRVSGGSERVQVETLRRDLQEASQRLEMLKAEKAKSESEASMYSNLAGKMEADLKSLSDAYNSLEQANFLLEKEVTALKGGGATPTPDVEAIRAEAKEEAQKESEAELNDLLVCLGQEQSKVEKLTARLLELGEDVDKLLEGIGDEIGLPDDDEEEDD